MEITALFKHKISAINFLLKNMGGKRLKTLQDTPCEEVVKVIFTHPPLI